MAEVAWLLPSFNCIRVGEVGRMENFFVMSNYRFHLIGKWIEQVLWYLGMLFNGLFAGNIDEAGAGPHALLRHRIELRRAN